MLPLPHSHFPSPLRLPKIEIHFAQSHNFISTNSNPFTLKPLNLVTKQFLFYSKANLFLHFPFCKARSSQCSNFASNEKVVQPPSENKNFLAAVMLIIGTAVGPGMLGLPSLTIKSGPIPSTFAIILSWIYVISSIILVAELSFYTMREKNIEEVSFTSLASNAFGKRFGSFVAVVYTCLSFSLLIACVSGIGSLIMQIYPLVNFVTAHAIVPCLVGAIIVYFPFKAIDVTNRALCALMLFSITALVTIGLSFGRSNLSRSLNYASWRLDSVLPAIPVTVLTLGFHVITPFVCKIVGDSMYDARKAILFGGVIPLIMVLFWNLVVLGLVGSSRGSNVEPIKLLLTVNPLALPAVQGFAFAALATSLIGYAVGFPKQLVDTMKLILENFSSEKENESIFPYENSSWNGAVVTWIVIIIPILITLFFPSVFSKAIDFAGVYANCFLFGVLPPVMAWIHRSSKNFRSSDEKEVLLPGGNVVLVLLFVIAVILGIWH